MLIWHFSKIYLNNVINSRMFVTVIFIVVKLTEQVNFCPTDYSAVLMKNLTAKWPESKLNTVVLSHPVCINNKDSMVSRICTKDGWYPPKPPVCTSTIIPNKLCPENFVEQNDLCTLIGENQQWDHGCPFLSQHLQRKIRNFKVTTGKVWLPIKKKELLGNFEYTNYGETYGNVASFNTTDTTMLNYKESCVAYDTVTNQTLPEACSNLNTHVCIFRYDHDFHKCPKNCQSAGLGTFKCFCKIHKDVCDTPAKIYTPADLKLLKEIAQNDVCSVGETLLKPPLPDLSPKVSKNSWFYTNATTSCTICERSIVQFKKITELVLSFEERKKSLYLLVYFEENVLKTDNVYNVYCFTNAAQNLREKVKIKERYRASNGINFIVFTVKLESLMGEYWCEVFDLELNIIKSNTVIAFKKRKGYEFALRLVINLNEITPPVNNVTAYISGNLLKKDVEPLLSRFDTESRVMEFFSYKNNQLDVLLHLTTKTNKTSVNDQYYACFRLLQELPYYYKIVYLKSSEYCLREKTITEENELSWPNTQISKSVVSTEICLESNGIPATRTCQGNFLYGSEWSRLSTSCKTNTVHSQLSNYLHDISYIGNINVKKIKIIIDLIETNEVTVLDLYYISQILENIQYTSKEKSLIPYIGQLMDALILSNQVDLIRAQNLLNSTDEILEYVDNILSYSDYNDTSVGLFKEKNLIIHITNPFESNVSGIALYGSNETFSEITVKNIYRNQSIESLLDAEDLHLIVFVPEELLDHILEDFDENQLNVHTVITIFNNDSLFVSGNGKKSASNIVSLSIPGYGSFLKAPLQIIFKSNSDNITAPECGFWDYGKKTGRKKGLWSNVGGSYVGKIDHNNLQLCNFSHLTHFALLIFSEEISEIDGDLYIEYEYHDDILEIISIIGSILTILGTAGIVLTAVLFEKWRARTGTKILLNLSCAIFLESVAIYCGRIDETTPNASLKCRFIGFILHYVVLSKFFWMLVYAYLQYLRFVKVLAILPNNLLLKSSILGWGLPLIPVIIVAVEVDYDLGKYSFCYPKGLSLYLGVHLPVAIIIFANLIVFIKVMIEVNKSRLKANNNHKKSSKPQIYLAILLFFVLGIPWVFCILAVLIDVIYFKIILVYIFCFSATLQGFVLFIFYVVLNKETRSKWIALLSNIKFYKNDTTTTS